VERSRDQLLPRPALSRDQHGKFRGDDAVERREDAEDRRALAKDLAILVLQRAAGRRRGPIALAVVAEDLRHGGRERGVGRADGLLRTERLAGFLEGLGEPGCETRR
jgi:hypothetical protein